MNKADSKNSDSLATATDRDDSVAAGKSINGVALSRYAVFSCLAIAGCAFDLITKQLIFDRYFRPDAGVPVHHWWIDGVLGIETSVNLGALWGMGSGQQFWFATLSVLAFLAIVCWLFVYRAAHSWVLTMALGLISGGIFGNLYDRLGLWHGPDMPERYANGVRDWIHFRWQSAPEFLQGIFNPWPNFNIADSVLVCGAILLVFHAFFLQPKPKAKDEDS